MRYGKCIASNSAIAEIVGVDDRTVRVGLERLEAAGFLKRHFRDPQHKVRSKITCIVRFDKIEQEDIQETPTRDNQDVLPSLPDDRPETPREFAKRFFEGDDEAMKDVIADVLKATHNRVPKDALVQQMRKFVAYWTEPNGSGTKVKWQMQSTFEVRRRIYTWLSRASQPRGGVRSGAGVVL
jgi:DNA-binding Lrp family transcriptional regulator